MEHKTLNVGCTVVVLLHMPWGGGVEEWGVSLAPRIGSPHTANPAPHVSQHVGMPTASGAAINIC